jgi:hypothetical protein
LKLDLRIPWRSDKTHRFFNRFFSWRSFNRVAGGTHAGRNPYVISFFALFAA